MIKWMVALVVAVVAASSAWDQPDSVRSALRRSPWKGLGIWWPPLGSGGPHPAALMTVMIEEFLERELRELHNAPVKALPPFRAYRQDRPVKISALVRPEPDLTKLVVAMARHQLTVNPSDRNEGQEDGSESLAA